MNLNLFRNVMVQVIAFAFIISICRQSYAACPTDVFDEAPLHQHGTVKVPVTLAETLGDSIAPDSSGMGSLSSVEFSRRLVPGWNVGNSLDAIPSETAWGNPLITQSLIDSVKAAGFNSVRIPVAWSSHFVGDTSTYTIDSTWLARVEQVVKYVMNDSMYAIINEHWDGGWQQPTSADSAYVNHRLAVMWEQIAIHFRDYNDHLLFAGMNEVAVTNDYGNPTPERARVESSFDRTFVNTVRSTGGRNYYRYLLVQGYRTDINATVGYFNIPTDAVTGRLMIEVHYYDPYDFTLNTGSSITEWGKYATDPSKTETWANESYADGQFQKVESDFVDRGYGVVVGEYGAIARLNLGSQSLNASYAAYRLYYMQYITRSMERHELVPVCWDNGGTGNFGMGVFNRSTGARVYPDIIDAIVDTGEVSPVTGVLTSPARPTNFFLQQNYPNPFNPTTTISYSVPRRGNATLKIYNILGQQVATLFRGLESAGSYVARFDGSRLPSGVYLAILIADGHTAIRTMTLLK